MRQGKRVCVIIPALDEERAIARVIREIPGWVDQVVVGDNGSKDATAENARRAGAEVVHEPRRGYGSACLTAMKALDRPEVVVFLDGDYSDYAAQMDRLVDPIIQGRAGIVIGSRVLGKREPGALTPQARFGNWLSCFLMRLFWGVRYTDLGPFRAVSWPALKALGMRDPNYGWTVEMQIKAAISGLSYMEAPVDYRRRIGVSHVSGNFKGAVSAGGKILFTIFRSLLDARRNRPIN